MNKKGFTLIELISTIVILSLIALVVFPAITSTIQSSRDSALESQKNVIKNAAKAYYLDHVDDLPNEVQGSTNEVDIYNLIQEGYISEEELTNVNDLEAADKSAFQSRHPGVTKVIMNPKNNKPLEGKVRVTYQSNQYVYEFISS